MRYSLKSLEWLNGVDELVLGIESQGEEENDQKESADDEIEAVSLMLEWKMRVSEDSDKCTTCECNIDFSDRSALLEHYQSDWHKINLRRKAKNKPIISEEDYESYDATYEEYHSQNQSTSDVTDGSDNEDLESCLLPTRRAFFVQNNQVFSISRNILLSDEVNVSNATFSRPFDCTIILLNGGHFAAGIFENDRLVQKHTFHRYVSRAKQGGVQSQHDASHGNAKSAGANLRRYNESKLKEAIQKLLLSWKSNLEKCPLIFLRCASYHKALFFDSNAGFCRGSPRIRTIPFETNRPSLEEIVNVWNKLQAVEDHGNMEQFRKAMFELRQKRKKIVTKVAKSRKLSLGGWEQKSEKERQKKENGEEKKQDHIKPKNDAPKPADKWPLLTGEFRKKIYSLIRTNNREEMETVLKNHDYRDQIIDYIRNARFLPKNWTFLHVCAAKQLTAVLKFLLEDICCDPSSKDVDGLPPYSLSSNKDTKAIFIKFREENPERYVWNKTHIPEAPTAKSLTPEDVQRAQEKKQEKKMKQKERLKAKKEAERKIEEEKKETQRWLKLSDRERRAEIVERRLAGLPPITRCEQFRGSFSTRQHLWRTSKKFHLY